MTQYGIDRFGYYRLTSSGLVARPIEIEDGRFIIDCPSSVERREDACARNNRRNGVKPLRLPETNKED